MLSISACWQQFLVGGFCLSYIPWVAEQILLSSLHSKFFFFSFLPLTFVF